MFELTKNYVDLGLATNRLDEHLAFWADEAGLAYDHLGKLGGGFHQHRHHMNGSILKVNHTRAPLDDVPPGGIRRLRIARDGLDAPLDLADPDGDAVQLVPPAYDGIEGIGIDFATADPIAFEAFYAGVFGLEKVGERTFRCGDSLLSAVETAPVSRSDNWRARGFRYITVQIADCDATHRAVLAAGGEEGMPPKTLGDTVRYSFVRDPDGNWIELSERASLTGGLIKRA